MTTPVLQKKYDLEDRCLTFASDVRAFMLLLPQVLRDSEDVDQAKRSSAAVGANYVEANEALGKGDFRMRLRIARKEAKECRFWLRLLQSQCSTEVHGECARLVNECRELELILSAIIRKVSVS